ncbi:MAG: hypothetical protein QXQ79_01885 [Candidatus Nanoarchaeia archaeon]
MALFNLFKKKQREDYLDLRKPEVFPSPAPSTPAGVLPENIPELPTQYPPMTPPTQPTGTDFTGLKQQLDAVNYKLDALKAALDAINTRLANIETALKTTPGGREGWNY